LVERLPPIWQVPSAPRLSGNSRSCSAAILQDDPGLDRDGEIGRIDCAHLVHAAERQHDVVPVLVRHAAAAQAGIAALGHDRQAGFGADPDDFGDLFGIGGPHDQRGLAAIEPAPFQLVRLDVGPLTQPALRSDHLLDPVENLGHGRLLTYFHFFRL
jgi:hypothetical protein